MFRQPVNGYLWFKDRISPKSPLEQRLPWISYPAIHFLKGYLTSSMKVFEFGGGGSTLFFESCGCSVRTAESSQIWARHISSGLSNPGQVDLRLVELEEGAIPTNPERIQEYLNQIHSSQLWDVILIDCLEVPSDLRIRCLKAALPMLAPAGLVIFDDSWRKEYADVPRLLADFQRYEFWGLGPARWGVTKTDIYTKAVK